MHFSTSLHPIVIQPSIYRIEDKQQQIDEEKDV